jgi:hypothetical protein
MVKAWVAVGKGVVGVKVSTFSRPELQSLSDLLVFEFSVITH